MMKQKVGVYIFLFIIASLPFAHAQISHGGKPLPFTQVQTRSAGDDWCVEMPAFDLAEELRLDSLEETGLRGAYKFAYKFMTNYNRGNSGMNFTLADGTRVWRLGIRSPGALSLNILFSEFELPQGAQVFLYDPAQTQVLGAFTHQNNSSKGILPVSPVRGDYLIIEYQEPADAAFPGRLTVGEVNHGYRDLRGYEPQGNRNEFACMTSPICFDEEAEYADIARSVVLITIDGVRSCTGVLVNNTSNDGTPYLLTASHCLNDNFRVENTDYEMEAGKIVCFFNYQSPTCDPVMRGTEEMSMASASFRAVYEETDMLLLELLEKPPVYYRPYYAGWNIKENGDKPPYAGIHHPRGSVKRINLVEEEISIETFDIKEKDFDENAHWYIEQWTSGSTASGSSGSPLFGSDNRVIGAMSGGASTCSLPVDDYYYALSKCWEASPNSDEQLKYWLDPSNSQATTTDGLDPYAYSPAMRLSNVYDAGEPDSVEIATLPQPASGNLFGSNSLKTIEYAEAYTAEGKGSLYGAFFVTPSVTDIYGSLEVEVSVYSGESRPEERLYTTTFKPTYTEKSIIDNTFIDTNKPMNRQQESFIRFDQPVSVSGNFYIGYTIKSPDNSTFAVYNLRPGTASRNTAWINMEGSWTQASSHPLLPFNTSLFIDPVVSYGNPDATLPVTAGNEGVDICVGADGRTIYISLSDAIKSADFMLYSTAGKLIHRTTLRQPHTAITLSNLSPGIYIINVCQGDLFYIRKIYFK